MDSLASSGVGTMVLVVSPAMVSPVTESLEYLTTALGNACISFKTFENFLNLCERVGNQWRALHYKLYLFGKLDRI